jgi:hypothetical protein
VSAATRATTIWYLASPGKWGVSTGLKSTGISIRPEIQGISIRKIPEKINRGLKRILKIHQYLKTDLKIQQGF